MSAIQEKFDEYKAEHGHAPNATQLSRAAGVKYRVASSFLRDMQDGIPSSPKPKRVRSQTLFLTNASKGIFPSTSRVRTSSFSDEVLFADESKQTSSTSPGIDYSGSTTGANNPWKRFQKKSASSYSSFSHSYTPTKVRKPVESKSKSKPKKESVPKQPTSTSAPPTTTKSVSCITVKPYSNIPTSRSMPSMNITELQVDLISLNAKYERECKQIRVQFEEIRNELKKKENTIIDNLTKYTNECRLMMERNINKTDKILKTSVVITSDNVKSEERMEKHEYVDVLQEVDDVEEKETPVDYSDDKTDDNNPWKQKQKDVTTFTDEVPPSKSKNTVKTFAPKTSNPDVESDEWSNSDSASW